jgi:hypothetical protein
MASEIINGLAVQRIWSGIRPRSILPVIIYKIENRRISNEQ